MKPYSTLTFITEEQKQFCDGALLGDGGYRISKNGKNAYFNYTSKYINMSLYVFHCLSSFGGTVYDRDIFDKRTNKTYHQTQYKSYSNPLITAEYYRWYDNNIKHLPQDLKLTPLVCLIWYLGDGCLVHRSNSTHQQIKLATHCFTKEEQENILLPQLQQFEARLVKAGKKRFTNQPQYAIIIPRRHVKTFLNYIGDCPLSEYAYKWNYIEHKHKEPVSHHDLEQSFIEEFTKDPSLTYYAIAKKFQVDPNVVKYYLIKNGLYVSKLTRPKT